MITNLYELGLALGFTLEDTLSNKAASWIYEHGYGCSSSSEGLRLCKVGTFNDELVTYPFTLETLMSKVESHE